MKRKIIALVLSLVLLIALIPNVAIVADAATTMNESTFKTKLNTFKSTVYGHGSIYKDNSSSTLGYQCFGYANYLAKYIFGSFPTSRSGGGTVNSGWKITRDSSAIDSLHVGDIVRYRYSTSMYINHSIFITAIDGNTVYYTDANSDSKNTVKWENKTTKAELKEEVTKYLNDQNGSLTSYKGFVAHFTNWQDTPVLTVKYHANGGSIYNSGITGYTYQVTESAGLNMRKDADTSAAKITALAKGTTFDVSVNETKTADGYTWGKTTVSGNTGWVVISDFVSKTATLRATKYYLDSSVVHKTSSVSATFHKMYYGETSTDGVYNAATLGLTREGYSFVGWSLSAEGETVIDQNQSLKPEEIYPDLKNGNKVVTLYAIWEKNAHSHSYSYADNNDGTHSYICTACGDVASTAKHNYPTVSVGGASATCTACGHEVFAWVGMSASLESSLQASFVVQTSKLPESGYYAVIEKEVYDKATGEISVETTRFEAADFANYNDAGTMKKIVFSGAAAKQMTDRFTVTIYNANGEQISASYTRTIEEYILSLFSNAKTSEAMKVVAVDFLNYGAAAQDKFGYRTTELANRGLTDELMALATADEAVADVTDARVKGKLLAGTAVAAEFEIIPSTVYQTSKIANVVKAEVSCVNFKGETVSYEVAAADFANYNDAGTMKKIEIKGTAVADGASPITVKLIDAEGNVLDETVECVNYYCARMAADHEVFNKLLKVIYSAKVAFA